MGSIKILDCTLRDGGYVNDWVFGEECISATIRALEEVGIDFIETGLIQDIEYCSDRTIYDTTDRVATVINNSYSHLHYGALIEMSNYYPPDKIMPYKLGNPDILRYSFWKRKLDDGLEYGRRIIDNGYKLCLQPTRVEQYSEDEFKELCLKANDLKPYALYIVDTFGLIHEKQLIEYARIADCYLDAGIILGYHAHDNMGQAFKNACAFIEMDLGNRDKQIDASIMGMGRGAGNLKLEQILEYLNYNHRSDFNVIPIYEIYDKYLNAMRQKSQWGYDLAYFITAINSCNPNYASFYLKNQLSYVQIEKTVRSITGADKYLYSDEKAKAYMKAICK